MPILDTPEIANDMKPELPGITATVTFQVLWPLATTKYGSLRPRYPLCDFKNAVAFGHKELWAKAANGHFIILICPQNGNPNL